MTGPGDRYRIQARTGEFTFLGHDRHRGRDVVLRRIPAPPELPGDERRALTLRSVRRARAASRLAHPAINPVLDAHADGDDAWLVCEPIDGRPLAETVAAEGPLPPHRVRALALDLLGALAAGHSAGLLHLDVQPATVWLTSGGRAVLTGYGAALPERFTPGTSPGRAITPPGAVPDGAPGAGGGRSVGTPGFTAPECLGGTGPVPASDLWSLAATLYFAVEGRPAFAGAGLAAVSAVLSSEPQPPARAGRLAPVLLGLLAKDPAQRPDALSARAAFEAAAGNGPGRTVRVGGRLLALGAAGLTLAVAAPAVALTIALTPPAPHVPAPVASPAPAATRTAATTPAATPAADPGATAGASTGPGASATPGAAGTPTGSPPAAVPTATAGGAGERFSEIPRPCSRLTDEQAQKLVPDYRKNTMDPHECYWTDDGERGTTIFLKSFLMRRGPLGDGTATAREFVLGKKQEADSRVEAAGKGDSIVEESLSPTRELAGVGDLAVAYDSVTSYSDDAQLRTEVAFSVSNLVIVLRCEREVPGSVKKNAGGHMRDCAEAAARHVVEGLD